MYRSKALGKNNFHFFTKNLDKVIQEKVAMQKIMLDALENHYFKLYYQPKVDIKTGKITSCEALIRLIDPVHGLIPPDKFINLAEENNFIIQLGEWIIQESARQILAWKGTPLEGIKVSINVSAKQFNDKKFVEKLSIYTRDIDKNSLDIELTESVFVNDFDEKFNDITQIKNLGFTLSLDDFGTGYSSLSYLKNIPFDTIKIDKTFIDDLEHAQDKNFVVMIINIAKTLNLEIVAEGVETQEQLEILKEMDCDIYQGYLCSKPLPSEEFEQLVKKNL
jgi:EAL domain-containing protein (putative c-di-GMP-specific phosphodiesterase class I)